MNALFDVQIIRVQLPMAKGGCYDYSVPSHLRVEEGMFVKVPLGPREVVGVVWQLEPELEVAADRLRDIIEVLPTPALPAVARQFIEWVAKYTMQAPGRILRMSMSVPDALYPPVPKKGYRQTGKMPDRSTAARQRVLKALEGGIARTMSEITELAGVSSSVVKGLEAQGVLRAELMEVKSAFKTPKEITDKVDLSEDQKKAADLIVGDVADGTFQVSLLEGVTGSGKTEVYFEGIAESLRQGKQALILLPEIALSSQWLTRFEERFGVKPVEWHSDLGSGARKKAWRAVLEGDAKVVVGARSALFLPFINLGFIVVDEEHEATFKQDEGVAYNARDMAVVRGQVGHHPVILASATPSLETITNTEAGKYRHIHMPSRFGGASLPAVELIDLKENKPGAQCWISEPLEQAVRQTLESGQQAMLFLNRRGYAPLTLCDTCGFRLQCPHCSAWLVEHRLSRRLQCHHCGYSAKMPKHCPDCESEDSFKACGPGIERLTEEATRLFPDARIAMVASDTITGPAAAAEFVDAMSEGRINLLLGTQIVAKGYHFPNLTLVGVVDADLGLAGGDLRASERTYQLLSQVAGRAGRAERPGKVLLQTHMPEHPVMQALASEDQEAFIRSEVEARQNAEMPPFGRLASVILSSPDPDSLKNVMRELSRRAPEGRDFMIMGPAPAPLSLIRGRHRFRYLLKASRSTSLQPILKKWLQGVKLPSKTRLQVDIDPYNFM
ncbi:primosomal protein N' [Sneathiella sp. P13V-1]|uniref:primosomal protein N' n=1 Tax=Sneathiella sp. P13V-1 TaxID=2697366 RepID=UPI00187B6B21|nr:primosomal protein N' [Sneathiella sp. P13V-1]MBE7636337.1 primosomal protein N' [Sneathiella sp. P13V-1]